MDTEWYDKTRVGHDPLERFMKFLYKDVKLSRQDYTNHSIRATVITNLDRAGFEARHIIAVTGHKSESTIKQYSRRCPDKKKRQMCESLGSKLLPKKPKMQNIPVVDNKRNTYEATNNPQILTNVDLNVQKTEPQDLNLTENLQLFPIDDTDDNLLLKVLNDFDKDNNIPQQNSVATVSNTVNNLPVQINPNLMPQMYFPNSTVTINYNFNSK